jgi:hypothetical protein
MEVDTGSFRALTARADAVNAIAADVAQIRRLLGAQVFEADRTFAAGMALGEAGRAPGFSAAMYEAAVAEGRRREAEERAPRHARPRRSAPGYLRLVGGSR